MASLTIFNVFFVKVHSSVIVAPVLAYLDKRSDHGMLAIGQNVAGNVLVSQAQSPPTSSNGRLWRSSARNGTGCRRDPRNPHPVGLTH